MIEVQGEEISNRVAVLDAIEPMDGWSPGIGPGDGGAVQLSFEPGGE